MLSRRSSRYRKRGKRSGENAPIDSDAKAFGNEKHEKRACRKRHHRLKDCRMVRLKGEPGVVGSDQHYGGGGCSKEKRSEYSCLCFPAKGLRAERSR